MFSIEKSVWVGLGASCVHALVLNVGSLVQHGVRLVNVFSVEN